MSQTIAVINAGSSSMKFSMYAVDGARLSGVASGQVDGLGTAPRFKAKDAGGGTVVDERLSAGDAKAFSHPQAFWHIARWVQSHLGEQSRTIGVGHRIVHGGMRFTQPVLIDPDVLGEIEKIVPLMPLHLPSNMAAVRAVKEARPDLPQVACFDTAFHQGRAKVTQRFGLPEEMFEQGIRRWGYHGLSYDYIASQLPGIDPKLKDARVIVAHLGSGASMCAMRGGKCVDTTMSFSALDGLPMGTRCGSLDPGVILFLLQQGMTGKQIEEMLYKKSGLLGISGISNDVRDLLASSDERAAAAIEYFVYRIVREIGSLTAALGGLDALVFTAGIGQNAPVIRARVCEKLQWLDVAIDPELNEKNATCITPAGQEPSVWVIPTDEERVIATHTLEVIRRGRM